MYTYTITFYENIKVEKARQGLLVFLEVFYDSTKAMICPTSHDSESEVLFFSDGVSAPRFAEVETIIAISEYKTNQFLDIVNNILNQDIIEKIKLSYSRN